ncbi:ABC transporter permease [Leucobacter rhizosphaerae]|uniref:ABC transporter permease n=1 Tax=Leucobacter rhizosphaerae TaxID=2932245 RepID=A0ABY4FZC8_9MICO|nr:MULTISPECIES: ABC transporter permease [Leucobacter]UOQ61494.1 ABC transporter permease [Leucobacter rhizosphaerae]UOR02402.1 ABC transporter permease [Leucobacter allii]
MRTPRWITTAAFVIAGFMVLPTLVVIPLSFTTRTVLSWPPSGFDLRWYEEILTDRAWQSALVTSLQTGVLTAVCATVLGTGIALSLSRGRYIGRRFFTIAVLAPMIVPTVILAIGAFFVFSSWGFRGSVVALAAAHTVIALPLVIVSVLNSLSQFDRTLELAGYSLGAHPVRVFFTVTLPNLLPGVLAGAMFAFIISWDEVVISLFLSSPRVRTLPVLIFSQISSGVEPSVAAAASLLMAVTLILLIGTRIPAMLGRKRKRLHAHS